MKAAKGIIISYKIKPNPYNHVLLIRCFINVRLAWVSEREIVCLQLPGLIFLIARLNGKTSKISLSFC